MKRATTPTHTFCFPTEYEGLIAKVLLTYSQNGEIILEKNLGQGYLENNVFTVTLKQEETNLFTAFKEVDVQIRAVTTNGTAVASDVYHIPCERVLNDEVL